MRITKISMFLVLLVMDAAYAGMPEIRASNNQLAVQIMTVNMDYGETDSSGVLLDTEKGPVPGRMLVYSRMWGKGNGYFQASYSRNEGRTDYVGGLIGPPSTPYGSVVTTSGAIITDYSLRLGKGFESGKTANYLLTPYLELGRHEWERGVNAGENYYHNYYGAGLLWQFSSANSRLVTSINGLAGNTFGSYIDVMGSFSGALGNSPLYKAGIGLDYALTKFLHLNAAADYIRFAYGQSDVYAGYLEPDSTTTLLQYRAGFGFAF